MADEGIFWAVAALACVGSIILLYRARVARARVWQERAMREANFSADFDIKGSFGQRLAGDKSNRRIYCNGVFIDATKIISQDVTETAMKDRVAYYLNINTGDLSNARVSFHTGFGTFGFRAAHELSAKVEIIRVG